MNGDMLGAHVQNIFKGSFNGNFTTQGYITTFAFPVCYTYKQDRAKHSIKTNHFY